MTQTDVQMTAAPEAETGAPTPAQTNWHLFPKRLARHEDPAVRRLFSHWSVCMGEWAATDWSDDYRATMPNAV